jgi:hypothetical protein
MKKYMLILFQWPIELLMAQTTMQLSADAGYYTGMKFRGTHGRFAIENSLSYEGAVSFSLERAKNQKDISIDLQYTYASSSIHFEPYDTDKETDERAISIHSLLVGIGKKFGKGNVQPIGRVLMGVTILNPYMKVPLTRFTFSFIGGIKLVINSFMGLHLQAKASFPVMYNTVYTAWEPDVGLTSDVSSNGIVVSGYFSGGLYIILFQ